MRLLLIAKPTLAAALLSIAACGGDNNPPQPTGEQLASVNNVNVTDGEFEAWLQRRGVKDSSKLAETNRQIALDELTTLAMMAQEAEKRGIAAQVVNELAIQRKALLADKLLEDELNRRPISEAAVAAEYKRREADMAITQYRARHILVSDESRANELIAELNNGADFAKLATKHSTEASKNDGGNLGWFELREMLKPFADEVEGLSTGRFSQTPLKTDLGWHIVKAEGNRMVPAPSLKEMEPQLRKLMRARRIEQFISELKADYRIDLK